MFLYDSLRIADLPENERPRERFDGPKILANAELIAILLGTGQGSGKLSAVALGQSIYITIIEPESA